MSVDTIARGLALKGVNQSGSNSVPYLINRDPPRVSKWSTVRGNAIANQGTRPKLALLGDSTTMGRGAQTGSGSFGNSRAFNVPTLLTAILNARGLPAQCDSWWGDNNATETYFWLYDTRVTRGTTAWAVSGDQYALSGSSIANSTDTSSLSFTVANTTDTVEIGYQRNTGNGTFTVTVDGGSVLNTTNSAGALGLIKATVSVPRAGNHTFSVQPTVAGGGAVKICSMEAYDSLTPKVAVYNWGLSGAKASSFTLAGTPNRQTQIHNASPDLLCIDLGINDANQGVAISSYTTDMQKLIDKGHDFGDVVLQVPVPSGTVTTAAATQLAYANAIKALASVNSLPVLDMAGRWVSYDYSVAKYYDTLHPTYQGYADHALALSELVLM